MNPEKQFSSSQDERLCSVFFLLRPFIFRYILAQYAVLHVSIDCGSSATNGIAQISNP